MMCRIARRGGECVVVDAMRLLRAYSEIGLRTTKYALVGLAESLRNKQRG